MRASPVPQFSRALQCAFFIFVSGASTKSMKYKESIPVIDLFAGPGGLGEGFSSIGGHEKGVRKFQLRVSIEKDAVAHATLSLRALFRAFPKGEAPEAYYQYIRGEITREELFNHPDVPAEAVEAAQEAKLAELGKISPDEVDNWIKEALVGAEDWVLIGGPPCQAYSVAGRARRTRESQEEFESDEKHFLYKEYLRIIREFKPTIFVMENVKGILSSKHSGSHIFQQILEDLSAPARDLSYNIRSLVVPKDVEKPDPHDFVIQAERHGLPQARHRVILLGIRSDVASNCPALLESPHKLVMERSKTVFTVGQALSGLPPIRSKISRGGDSLEAWLSALDEASSLLLRPYVAGRSELIDAMKDAAVKAQRLNSNGGAFIPWTVVPEMNAKQRDWFLDTKLKGVLQHEARSHMRSDLHRYIFAASYAKLNDASPKIHQFPVQLLPAHENVSSDSVPFSDRFRVQMKNGPSTTVVAHIAKDGHYYIHPDPSQCRSLTVREAARLQTFPDNYFFEGNRTQQYTQIGNAVPPLLARKIAAVVAAVIDSYRSGKNRRASPKP
ncbi:DNA (cytosine-5)-methyltransferase 1 [Pseudomonas costantinii]|uniref:DNA (cytosine-5-)-methyltransferase n=2 Tax=Pseudomonas costantinii TaxID=168469 RepID=A0A1H5CQX2_9PSED|nr:DNA cytosine methyltransferase [Pseudomonas costantinii]SED69057.1 DNA (cytosine-5)-methyltransferase 1 [Pseudomonas costantinii]